LRAGGKEIPIEEKAAEEVSSEEKSSDVLPPPVGSEEKSSKGPPLNRDSVITTIQQSISDSSGQYIKNKSRLPLKIALCVSCIAVTVFGAAVDKSTGSDIFHYLGWMITAAIMVHLFASQLFKEYDNKD
jgi:hypothetical protein